MYLNMCIYLPYKVKTSHIACTATSKKATWKIGDFCKGDSPEKRLFYKDDIAKKMFTNLASSMATIV